MSAEPCTDARLTLGLATGAIIGAVTTLALPTWPAVVAQLATGVLLLGVTARAWRARPAPMPPLPPLATGAPSTAVADAVATLTGDRRVAASR